MSRIVSEMDLVNPESTTTLAASPVISMEGVGITYSGQLNPVISDATLSIHRGETVLFMGPSGCGKSTLAMLCARLIPSSVEAQVSGRCQWSDGLLRAGGIGYVFQDPDAQFCQLTVADELAFGLENRCTPRGLMEPKMTRALTEANLDVPLQADHSVFSGGMKQKLAIASALALKPDLLVLDEPTANLDPHASRLVFDLIADLKSAGQTMIVIEHKFDRLLEHMDTVVLFDQNGRIYKVGPTLETVLAQWDWLVSQGVVAPWRHRPQLSAGVIGSLAGTAARESASASVAFSGDGDKASSLSNASSAAFTLARAALKYGRHTVWQDVNLNIARGALTAIVGPNGSGKSSLLQVLAGLQKPAEGHLALLGKDMGKWSKRERVRAISYCFQNPEFQFVYERVADELANRVVKEQVPESVLDLLREFGLSGTEDASPFALSQGQKRRLSVASMLREEHEVYLLDEPTFGQDAATQQVIVNRLVRLVKSGKTVVFTTHDMDLVRNLASFVIVLGDSGVLFHGPPKELFTRRDTMAKAHLIDDWDPGSGPSEDHVQNPSQVFAQNPSQHLNRDAGRGTSREDSRFKLRTKRQSLASQLNPSYFLIGMMAAGILAMLAHTMEQALLMLAFPVLLMLIAVRMTPWQIAKRFSPFIVFYLLYVWSFAAYSAVPEGTRTVSFLWVHLSWYGLQQGEVLALRMLASVAFAILFISAVDMTDLIVSLVSNLSISPKFAYGTLAGLRAIGLFQTEWTKLSQARQVRGKAGSPWLRPVTYALPLLSQAIRMSERVAIAMEARGFTGPAAQSRQHRTFYRQTPVRWQDYAFAVIVPVIALLLLFV